LKPSYDTRISIRKFLRIGALYTLPVRAVEIKRRTPVHSNSKIKFLANPYGGKGNLEKLIELEGPAGQ